MNLRDLRIRHGLTKTPEHRAWCNMRTRCFNPRATQYPHYGGRGITVCERWDSFANFLFDVGPRPSRWHSIERRDNDGNYEPGNVRWATKPEQARNRRTSKLTANDVNEIRGRAEHGEFQRRIARRFGVGQRTIAQIIHREIWRDVP